MRSGRLMLSTDKCLIGECGCPCGTANLMEINLEISASHKKNPFTDTAHQQWLSVT